MRIALLMSLLALAAAVYTIIQQQAELVQIKAYGGKLGEAYMDQQRAWMDCEQSRFLNTQEGL